MLKAYKCRIYPNTEQRIQMEWMAIVAVAAVLITIAAKCGAAIKSKLIAIAQSI